MTFRINYLSFIQLHSRTYRRCIMAIEKPVPSIILTGTPPQTNQARKCDTYWQHSPRRKPIFKITSRNTYRAQAFDVFNCLTDTPDSHPLPCLSPPPVIILSIICLLPLQRGVYAVARVDIWACATHPRVNRTRFRNEWRTHGHIRVQVRT